MAERKAQQKWYPVDWEPKHGSVNKVQGSHPLRERAKKLDQGILVIRLEMPFNAWCLGCNAHIGMGVRYNAEKEKVGMYHSTPILQFRLKCHLCDNIMILQTDPQNRDYVFISGGRRKEQRWDPSENEQVIPMDREEREKIDDNAMYRLEHGARDKAKLDETAPIFKQRLELQSKKDDDELILNRSLRSTFREMRKASSQTVANGSVRLLPCSDHDKTQAAMIKAFATHSKIRSRISPIAKAVDLIRKKQIPSKASSNKKLKVLNPSSSLAPLVLKKPSISHLVADYSSSDTDN